MRRTERQQADELKQPRSFDIVEPKQLERPASVAEPVRESKSKKPRRSLKTIKIFLFIIVFILIVAGCIYWFVVRSSSGGFPESIKSQAQFQLYYPARLPAGYEIKADSYSYANGVLIFSVTDQTGKKSIAITEQTKPSGFNFDQLKGDVNFDTNIGKAVIQNSTVQVTGSIVADNQTWVIVNSPAGTDVRIVRQVLSGLR